MLKNKEKFLKLFFLKAFYFLCIKIMNGIKNIINILLTILINIFKNSKR